MYAQVTATGIKYQEKEISFTPAYQELINLFDKNDVFQYNDKDVQATSRNKCIINDASKTIRIPLGNNSFVQMHWHHDMSLPLTTRIFYQDTNKWPTSNFTYDELAKQCKTGEIQLKIKGVSPIARKTIQTVKLNRQTSIQEIQKLFAYCNTDYEVFQNTIKFIDGMLDNTHCRIHIKFDDDNTLQSIALYPQYQFNMDVFSSTSKTAKFCQKKLLEEINLQPKTNTNQKDGFFLLYDFDKIKLSTSLSYTPRDGYPEWSGIVICFM